MFSLVHPSTLSKILQQVSCTEDSYPIFQQKSNLLCIRANHVGFREATILKQTFLRHGGDVAVHKHVLNHAVEDSTVLMIGTEDVFSQCIQSLTRQNYFHIPIFRENLKQFLAIILHKRKKNFPLLMGILNITPDSFSDGNECMTMNNVLHKATRLVEEGADILDIGGESTRPGATLIHEQEEYDRVIEPIKHIHLKFPLIPLSLDTHRVSIAKAGIDHGIRMINCVKLSKEMVELVAQYPDVQLVIMHMKGTPETMQSETTYKSLLEDIYLFFEDWLRVCNQAHIHPNRIILDPGIGFAKTAHQNIQILQNISTFFSLGCRILVGHSRKRFFGDLLQIPLQDRDLPTALIGALLWEKGVDILRVHNINATKNALKTVFMMHS
jgi:dihydropteroate synthase